MVFPALVEREGSDQRYLLPYCLPASTRTADPPDIRATLGVKLPPGGARTFIPGEPPRGEGGDEYFGQFSALVETHEDALFLPDPCPIVIMRRSTDSRRGLGSIGLDCGQSAAHERRRGRALLF